MCGTLGPAEVARRVVRNRKLIRARLDPRAPDQLLIDQQYQGWLKANGLGPERRAAVSAGVAALAERPLVSLLMPVYDVEERWLRKAVGSVSAQMYPHWELCAVDDASPSPHVRAVLAELAAADPRIRVRLLDRNEGICGASNHALQLAQGDFVGLLDHDDVLQEDALYEVVRRLNDTPDADLVYSDQDVGDSRGRRIGPLFKPDWSPDLLLSMNYITHFSVYRRSLVLDVGGFRKGFEGAQDYDLLLRVTERARTVAHVPRPLYSWVQSKASVAANPQAKPYAHEAGRRALAEALVRRGIDGEVLDGYGAPYRYRVKRRLKGRPLVSIVIPTRDNVDLLRACIESLETRTAYDNFEILVVDNDSRDPATLEYLSGSRHRVVRYPHPFDYARINNVGAAAAKGEQLLFLNDDTAALEPSWLEAMVEHAQRPEVGAVGAKLLFPDGTIQHAGIVVGLQGKAGHAFWGFPGDHPGYYDFARVIRNYSAVTGACLLTRKAVFDEVDGFDEAFAVSYNDVDLCLRMRQRGYWIVYTPYAALRHHQSASRGPYDPAGDRKYEDLLRARWGQVIADGDPFYNPGLTRERFDFTLRT
jgi:GT2 family glycosyltransferase